MPKKMIKAFDNKVEIVSEKINENGYLVIKCIFARTGIQERYGAEIGAEFEQSKLYKEYRSPDEVFKPEVIKAFQNVVITNDHPDELLTPENTTDYAIGFVSSSVEIIDKQYLQCEITIYEINAIADIQSGKLELSAGYLYSIVMVENPQYDYIQTDIKPNHIALVDAGRCGSKCSLALDNKKPNSKKGVDVKIIFKIKNCDGEDEVIREIEIADEAEAKEVQSLADALYEKSETIATTSKAKDEEVETLKTESGKKDEEIEESKKAIDRLQAKVDNPPLVASDSAKISRMANDLVAVMMVGKDCDIEVAGKDVKTIQKEVITKYNPDLAKDGKLDKQSDAYIDSAFDIISSQLKGADASYKNALTITQIKADDKQEKKTDEAKSGFDKAYGGAK